MFDTRLAANVLLVGGLLSSTSSIVLAEPASTSILPQAAVAPQGLAQPQADTVITFSDFAVDTFITNQYLSRGILFGGDRPFISNDGANPTSPVLSGSPRFFGAIEGRFFNPATGNATPVRSFSLDAGYMDAIGTVELTWYNAAGAILGSRVNTSTGIVRFAVTSPSANIARWRIDNAGDDPAGFAIDNVAFNIAGGPGPTNGDDNLTGTPGPDAIDALAGNDVVRGLGGDDNLGGGPGNDTLYGGPGNDRVHGVDGNDILYGDDGDDIVTGNIGVDQMWGGRGNDRFRYWGDAFQGYHSGVGAGRRDRIMDFAAGDLIELTSVDANATVAGNQAFQLIGAAPFSRPGQIRWQKVGRITLIQASTDADLQPEFEIELSNGAPTTSAAFLL